MTTEYKIRERSHGLLWFGIDQKDRWSITDPDSKQLEEACRRLRPHVSGLEDLREQEARTPEEKQRDTDLYTVLRVVSDYQHLTMYELGIEHIIKKLRAIWRAVREAREEEAE